MLSVVLYLALAIGLDHEVSKNFQGQHVFARPDWAFLAGVLAAACWAGQAMLASGVCLGGGGCSDGFRAGG